MINKAHFNITYSICIRICISLGQCQGKQNPGTRPEDFTELLVFRWLRAVSHSAIVCCHHLYTAGCTGHDDIIPSLVISRLSG
ncbi:hypothetical protein GDO78_017023 [Eleutherodactylus coqui]|uniref:Uncharacterized protein n=1 Tax=Eleutherodactylus coqui TaxID=57060 RepID=A0A8J6EKC3_ELECQ|nr:hypothetical protein GDO78_017023 [Eleutherodactylus coqui]